MSDPIRIDRFTWKKGDARVSNCIGCAWKSAFGPSCVAFPLGIPEDILDGRDLHLESRHGDNGFVFKPVERP